MDFAQPETQTYPAEALTSDFQVTGQLTPLGDLLGFLNDARRETLTLKEVQVTPLQADWRVGGFSVPELILPKETVQVFLVGEVAAEDLKLLPRAEHLVVFTDTFAINGHFHMGTEVKINDAFYVAQGPFFPASNAEVYAVRPLTVDVKGTSPIAFLNRHHVGVFYQP